MKLALSVIELNGGTQSRAELDHSAIESYGDAMQAGVVFPPIIVFYDGEKYWLADGFHRVEAADAAGLEEIDADVRQGTRREAVLFSLGANAHHGVRRTNSDKRRAVHTLLVDDEWKAWSDRKIADTCGVSHTMVAIARRELTQRVATVATPPPEPTRQQTQCVATEPPPAPVSPKPANAPRPDAELDQAAALERRLVDVVQAIDAAQPRTKRLLAPTLEDTARKFARIAQESAA